MSGWCVEMPSKSGAETTCHAGRMHYTLSRHGAIALSLLLSLLPLLHVVVSVVFGLVQKHVVVVVIACTMQLSSSSCSSN